MSQIALADVETTYRDWVTYYDNENNSLIACEQGLMHFALNQVKEGDTVLDAGCGTGRITELISERGAKVTGIDQSKEMLRVARGKKYSTEVKFKQLNLENALPFEDETFNSTISALVTTHINDLERYIQELTRVTRHNGTIIISDLHPRSNIHRCQFQGMKFDLRKYNSWKTHSEKDWSSAFRSASLCPEFRLEGYIGPNNRHCFAPQTYRAFQGEPYAIIYIMRKKFPVL